MSAEASIVLAREDRLAALFAPIGGGASRVTVAVLAGSAALHLAIVATAAVASRTSLVIPEQHETSVEVVQEVPKATPKVVIKAATSKKAAAPKEKLEPPPPPAAEALKQEKAKLDPTKIETPKISAPKTVTTRTETAAPPNLEAAKGEVAKTEAPRETQKTDEREALVKELAELRAQKAELNQTAAPEVPPAVQGTGPLPSSFQAVALPSSTAGVGEAMGYQDIVFSQLAKAKGLGHRQGMPGTTGVRFDIDAAGGLVDAEIVHPSGVAALDAEALDIVHRAAPFPPPPAGAQRSFTANVAFVVHGAP